MDVINVNSLEPNSKKYKAEKANELENKRNIKKSQPIINKDQIVSTKKPFRKKIAQYFLKEDIKDIKSWLIWEVVIPGIKDTILNTISLLLCGEAITVDRGRSSRGRRISSREDYTRHFNSRLSRRRRDNVDDYCDSDDEVDFRNIILRNKEDAEIIVRSIRRRINDCGSASIAELLDLMDLTCPYTYNNWGWDDERDIGIRQVSNGNYLIDVAEPKYLD